MENDGATCHCSPSSDKPPLIEKGTEACATCGASYLEDYRRPFYSRYTPLVIVGQCPQHGLFFTSPTAADLTLIEQADVERVGWISAYRRISLSFPAQNQPT